MILVLEEEMSFSSLSPLALSRDKEIVWRLKRNVYQFFTRLKDLCHEMSQNSSSENCHQFA